jgi:O-antigen/teichoic acid export membrane protein
MNKSHKILTEKLLSKDESVSMRNTFWNIIRVTISNIFTILAGVAVGFFVPKFLSINDYGMYKTFTLYSGYIGLASLGIIDGIVLKFGDCDYDKLDRLRFRSYFKWYLLIHSFFSILLIVIGICLKSNEYKLIVISLGLELIAVNFTGYFQYISQITLRFRELSFRNVLNAGMTLLGVLLLFILYKFSKRFANYYIYILIVILCHYVLMLWYLFTYRDISLGRSLPLKSTKKDILGYIRTGFPLSFSLLCSSLVLTIDRQFVSVFWPLNSSNEYAIYSFACNMLSLVTVATSAISTVIYPILKRTTKENLGSNYSFLVSIDILFVFICLSAYFPLVWFVGWFLPQYQASLITFRIIFPGLAISSVVTVVICNYYKVLNETNKYFVFSFVGLAISVLADLIAYFIFKTTTAISISSIFSISIWYLLSQLYLTKKYKLPWIKNTLALLAGCTLFYSISLIGKWYIGFAVYAVCVLIYSVLFFRKEFSLLLGKLKNKQGKI